MSKITNDKWRGHTTVRDALYGSHTGVCCLLYSDYIIALPRVQCLAASQVLSVCFLCPQHS